MSNPKAVGEVLRDFQKFKARRQHRKPRRPCPWFHGVRVTDLDESASQIPTTAQAAPGEIGGESSPAERVEG